MIKEDLIADLDYLESCLDEARNAILKVIELADSKGLIQEDREQCRAENGFGRNLAEEVVEGFDHLEKKREWVGLTDNERIDIAHEYRNYDDAKGDWFDRTGFARAIEAKLKEKNT